MDRRTTQITIIPEGKLTIPMEEYRNLIIRQTLLDMMLLSVSEYGTVDSTVTKTAAVMRDVAADYAPFSDLTRRANGGDGDAK